MDSKDAQESLESGGGGARCRCSNGRRNTAAVFVIQSLFTAVCAALSLSIFLNTPDKPLPQLTPQPLQDRGIFLHMKNSDELRFEVIWNQSVQLIDEKRVQLSCAGPYMVYLWACAKNRKNSGETANLTLEQGNKSFHLQTLQDGKCQQMQSVFMLSEKSDVMVNFTRVQDTFEIERLLLGLHYMLGAECFTGQFDSER
ncbi:hypothetical protein QQF64_016732 [Cirrhinus molitorella]|uniref:Uncharacterized protein n=2 Tax=Cirrhinus molitorella TaxID=172907 RepID=A0AA88PEE9_9TELE|nr:hypothetical protein Q8A67_017248 [Cirrhinus molitorella]